MNGFWHTLGLYVMIFVICFPFVAVMLFIGIKMGWLPGVKLPWEKQ